MGRDKEMKFVLSLIVVFSLVGTVYAWNVKEGEKCGKSTDCAKGLYCGDNYRCVDGKRANFSDNAQGGEGL